MKYITHSPSETKKLAGEILKKIFEQKKEGALRLTQGKLLRQASARDKKTAAGRQAKALVFALSGQLGAGKTKFVQGAAEFLGIERNVTSPTFVLMKRYDLSGAHRSNNVQKLGRKSDSSLNTGGQILDCSFYHFDCYRLHSSEEVLDLGWEKIISNSKNIVFIEWAEKVKDILPSNTICVTMKDKGENKREISVRFGNINSPTSL